MQDYMCPFNGRIILHPGHIEMRYQTTSRFLVRPIPKRIVLTVSQRGHYVPMFTTFKGGEHYLGFLSIIILYVLQEFNGKRAGLQMARSGAYMALHFRGVP